MLHKFITYISIRFSIFFFHKRQPVIYSLFNYFFNRVIRKREQLSKEVESFDQDGYCKIPLNFSQEIRQIKKNFEEKDKEKENTPRIDYFLNESNKTYLINMLDKKLDSFFIQLKNYYKTRPIIYDLSMWTNLNYKDDNLDKDHFAESYHNDGYLSNYIKIHINCHDIKLNDGPMFFVKKKFNRKFIKKTNYKDRFDYNKNTDQFLEDQKIIYKNTGLEGEAILFDPTMCFHKATIPQTKRSMIQLILFIPPSKNFVVSNNCNLDEIKKKYIKPYSLLKVAKLFYQYY